MTTELDKKTIDIHDRVNEAYFGLLGPNFGKQTQERIHWIGKYVSGEFVLDVGCSQGITSILIGREGRSVLGVDISLKSISEANNYLSREEEPVKAKVHFEQLDYINADFSEKKFDTIILSEVLEHLMNPEPFLEKAKKDLMENGKLIISVPFGINDFIDHKQTYYFTELHTLISKYFLVSEFIVIDKWIGFICVNTSELAGVNIRPTDFTYIEKAFQSIERKYINEVDRLVHQDRVNKDELNKIISEQDDLMMAFDESKVNYEGMEARFKKVNADKEHLGIQYQESQENIQTLEDSIRTYEDAASQQVAEISILTADNQQSQENIQTLESSIRTYEDAASQQVAEISTLTADNQQSQENIQTLESSIRTYEDAASQQVAENKALQSSLLTLESKLKDYELKLVETNNALEKAQVNFLGMDDRNKGLIKESSAEFDKLTVNLKGMDARNKYLNILCEVERGRVEKVKQTLSYKLGQAVINNSSPLTIIKLPYALYATHKKWKKDKKRVPVKAIAKAIKHDDHDFSSFSFQTSSLKDLKIASIMDEFTYNSFKYECNVMQVSPDNWQNEMQEQKPDIVFIESAWKGVDDLWEKKVSTPADELVEMLQWCREQGIPTLFWCKEDPVHFDTFIPTASLVDFVFTTDIDCVPKYKKELGHDRVYMLPFAAQPFIQNPIEKYQRKDAFCFAGSYYLRYPERQRDFSTLIDTVKEFKPVEIYDRNFEKPHPHYLFPDEYQEMIIGCLPFEEIDRAYKGYRYGINMNTIKQSQSMYARRVFELLASNTVCVSNFSRGLRLLFGDLVISSDDKTYIASRLKNIVNDDVTYRKFRLLGLRKVMSEHTYEDRLSYIASKIYDKELTKRLPAVLLVAIVNSHEDAGAVLASLNRQQYKEVELVLINNSKKELPINQANVSIIKSNEHSFIFDKLTGKNLFGMLSSTDYYGIHYLTDLVQASRYSKATAVGKKSYYQADNGKCSLVNPDKQYSFVQALSLSSSLVTAKEITVQRLDEYMTAPSQDLQLDKMLAIDEFNYCRNYRNSKKSLIESIVNDLKIDNGVSFEHHLSKVSDVIQVNEGTPILGEDTLPKLSAKQIFGYLKKPASSKIKLAYKNDVLSIISKFSPEQHAYIYATKQFTRDELNLVLNSQFTLKSESTLNLLTVFEFQDKEGKKISHQMNGSGTHALAIPPHCTFIRFGLKVTGNGKVEISELILGSHGEKPAAIVGRSPYLVLTKQYPSYEDLYKYGFLHTRVRAYKEQGMPVDVFRITNEQGQSYREFEGIDVTSGDAKLLDATLRTGQYKHILVHILDKNMWSILEKYLDTIKVTVWAHGAEIQVWQRRSFEFEQMKPEEVIRQKKLSDQRVKFWHSILTKPHKNLQLVFVSRYFADEVMGDLKLNLSKRQYQVIHNFIDSKLFKYNKKNSEQRKKILFIRSFASRKYASDLTISAILELSNRSFFKELQFHIIGDGLLFDTTVKPLLQFDNVVIEKKFITHDEISLLQEDYGVFLNPTRWDSQGVSRDEAMSSGLVAITTNVAAIPEFVDNSCGIVVPPEDPKAIADAIEQLYNHPELFLKLSQAASERVRKQSGFEQTIEKEMQAISSVKMFKKQ